MSKTSVDPSLVPYITPDLRPLAVPIDLPQFDPENLRIDHGVDETAASLKAYGQRKPIVINSAQAGKVEAGNGTLRAARALGWDYIAAVFVDDSPDTAVGYAIADNRTAELSRWDNAKLAQFLQSLPKTVPTGFRPDALQELLQRVAAHSQRGGGTAVLGGGNGETGGIAIGQELRSKWNVEPGQLWRLGEHRVICGDCRDTAVWERLAVGELVSGVFTSPPYAMQRKDSYGGVAEGEYVNWFAAVQENIKRHLTVDGSFFLNIKPHTEDGRRALYVFDLVLAMARQWGWCYIDELCWTDQGLPGRFSNRFKNGFEPIYHFAHSPQIKFFPEAVIRPFSVRTTVGAPTYTTKNTDHSYHIANNVTAEGLNGALPSNVIHIPHGITVETTGAYHGATFPPDLPDFFIKAFSAAGDTWLDPFLGSGTTLIACESLGRHCLGIEIKPEYTAVTLERWHKATNHLPELVQ